MPALPGSLKLLVVHPVLSNYICEVQADSVHNRGNKEGVIKAALANEIIALKVTKHSKSAAILSCQAQLR